MGNNTKAWEAMIMALDDLFQSDEHRDWELKPMPDPDDICEPALEGEPSDLEMVIYVNPAMANDVWANGLTVQEVVAVFRDLVMRGVVKVSIMPGDKDHD